MGAQEKYVESVMLELSAVLISSWMSLMKTWKAICLLPAADCVNTYDLLGTAAVMKH